MKKPQASIGETSDFMSILLNIGSSEALPIQSTRSTEKLQPTQVKANDDAKPKIVDDSSNQDSSISAIATIVVQDNPEVTIFDTISEPVISIINNGDINNGDSAKIKVEANNIPQTSANILANSNANDVQSLQLASFEGQLIDFAANTQHLQVQQLSEQATPPIPGTSIELDAQINNSAEIVDQAAFAALEAIGLSQTPDVSDIETSHFSAPQTANLAPKHSFETQLSDLQNSDEPTVASQTTTVVQEPNNTNTNSPTQNGLGKPNDEASANTLEDVGKALEGIEADFQQVSETLNQPEQNAKFTETPRLIDAPALAATMMRKFQNGERSFFIRLDPAELGAINIELKMGVDKKLRAVIAVEKPETLSELSKSIDNLAASLSDAGMELAENGISFTLDNSPNQGQGFAGFAANENLQHKGANTALAADENEIANPIAANENNNLPRTLSPHSQVWQRIRVSLVA